MQQVKSDTTSKKNQPQQSKVRKKTHYSLGTPYVTKWPIIAQEDTDVILESMHNKIKELKVGRMLREKVRIRTKGKQSKDAKKKDLINEKMKEWWERGKEARSHLALGLNAVIRGLENDQLCAALLCRDAKPSLISEFLLPLCSTRNVQAAALPFLSTQMSSALNFKTCLAVGFKKSVQDAGNPFHECFEIIKHRIPCLSPLLIDIPKDAKQPDSMTSIGKVKAGISLEKTNAVISGKVTSEETILTLESINTRPTVNIKGPELKSANVAGKVEGSGEEDYSYLYIKRSTEEVKVKTAAYLEEFVSLETSSDSEVEQNTLYDTRMETDKFEQHKRNQKRKIGGREGGPFAKRKQTGIKLDHGKKHRNKKSKTGQKFPKQTVSYKPVFIKNMQPSNKKKS